MSSKSILKQIYILYTYSEYLHRHKYQTSKSRRGRGAETEKGERGQEEKGEEREQDERGKMVGRKRLLLQSRATAELLPDSVVSS